MGDIHTIRETIVTAINQFTVEYEVVAALSIVILPVLFVWIFGLSGPVDRKGRSGGGPGEATMYIPKRFAIDTATACQYINTNAFAELISYNPKTGIPFVTHLPLLFAAPAKSKAGGSGGGSGGSTTNGVLTGHMARANPHWKLFESGQAQVLAIFNGPHSYVSPHQYSRKTLQVPTWNYTTVHVRGRIRIVSQPAEVERSMKQLIGRFEKSRDDPWAGYDESVFGPVRHMLDGIVAFEISIDSIEGKMKVSQQRETQDWLALYSAFTARNATADQRALAVEMKTRCPAKWS